MAQGMNKLNEALASLPEVRELLLSLDAGTSPIAVSGLSGLPAGLGSDGGGICYLPELFGRGSGGDGLLVVLCP